MNLEAAVANAGSDFHQALRAILGHFDAAVGTIHTMGPDGQLHMRAHSEGIPETVLAATQVIPVGKGLAGLAVERRAPVSLCNLQQDRSGDAQPGARATGARGSLCVPILAGDEAVGALGIATMGERTFTEAETQALLAAGRALAASII
jgi:L-methionine (R)-S-oxide reductase